MVANIFEFLSLAFAQVYLNRKLDDILSFLYFLAKSARFTTTLSHKHYLNFI